MAAPVRAKSLDEGQESYRRRAWSEAYEALSRADEAAALGGGDLELLATAAYLTGRDAEFLALMERAYQARLQADERAPAARCAFWLCLGLMFRGEGAKGSGWLARARRLIGDRRCVEQGYLLIPASEQRLRQGDPVEAHSLAERAAAIAENFADADLVSCARHLQGRALIAQGEVQAGLALLDEAMLTVSAGELSPIFTGLLYCSVIDACQQVYALGRAREWTAALSRWCEQQSGMVAFTGTCLVHRAEILQLQGAWPAAMAEACRACERFSRQASRGAPAAAFYQQGELHRLRGELAEAEQAYLHASRSGLEPQPGLALLRMAQGRIEAACAVIRRVLDSANDPVQRAKLLPSYVEIMLSAGDAKAAGVAARELERIATQTGAELLGATAAQALGAVALAEDDARAALGRLRRAFEIWQQIDAPYEAARTRMLIGLACRSLGDEESAALELSAARAVLEELGARPDLAALEARGKGTGPSASDRLTRRELQVLRLLAAGKTNKAIAAALSLSERTVDRHVSNIFGKLNVPSRAAATAHAYEHKLL